MKPISPLSKITSLNIFSLTLLLFLALVLPSRGLAQTEANFHLKAQDLDLKDFEQLIRNYLGEIEAEGKISLEGTFNCKQDSVIIESHFSSPKATLRGKKLFFPLELSQLEGDFAGWIPTNSPSEKEGGSKISHFGGQIRIGASKSGKLLFSKAKVDYLFKDKKLEIEKSTLHIADGEMEIQGSLDFTSPDLSFSFPLITTKEVKLEKLIQQLGMDKPASGILNSQAELSGQIKKPESYTGEVSIEIAEGELMGLPLLTNLITFFNLRLSLEKIVLEELSADFAIKDSFASTNNLKASGPGVVMEGEGKIGWDRSIDFTFSSYFSNEFLGRLPGIRIPEMILDKFRNGLLRIRVTGTLDKPVVLLVPLPVVGTWLEKLRQIFPFPGAKE